MTVIRCNLRIPWLPVLSNPRRFLTGHVHCLSITNPYCSATHNSPGVTQVACTHGYGVLDLRREKMTNSPKSHSSSLNTTALWSPGSPEDEHELIWNKKNFINNLTISANISLMLKLLLDWRPPCARRDPIFHVILANALSVTKSLWSTWIWHHYLRK